MKRSRLGRGKPLERRTPLQGGTPPQRKTPMPHGGRLDRAAPLRPVSAKRRAENRRRREMIAELWPVRPQCIVHWCTRSADDVHEPLTRARGGSITCPDNAVPVCRRCHDELGHEPEWGYTLGLLVHSWDQRTPAQIAQDRRAALAAWTPWEVAP